MKHVLVAAASSELASEVIPKLLDGEYRIGLHYSSNKKAVEPYEEYEQVKLIQCTIAGESDCARIVDEYVKEKSLGKVMSLQKSMIEDYKLDMPLGRNRKRTSGG